MKRADQTPEPGLFSLLRENFKRYFDLQPVFLASGRTLRYEPETKNWLQVVDFGIITNKGNRSDSPATPTHAGGETGSSSSVATFWIMALNMSWQLAIVFLVPVIGGVKLDKHFDTTYLFTFIGLGLATLGSAVVMRRTLKIANSLPVPKLTTAQKREIQKQYEEEDND